MKFTKMNGIGNDYVFIDCTNFDLENPEKLSIDISSRFFGVGSDGLILIKKGNLAKFMMEMYNSDGSYSKMCGNGLRCVARYLYDRSMENNKSFNIETGGILVSANIITDQNNNVKSVEIDMGKAILDASNIPVIGFNGEIVNKKLEILDRTFYFTVISMGNPHCVIFLENENLDSFDIKKYGPIIENHSIFPEKTNVEFVTVKSKNQLNQRTWERGSGETLACGSGACAVIMAGILNNKTSYKIINNLRGGALELSFDENTQHIFMKGSAEYNFEGIWNL